MYHYFKSCFFFFWDDGNWADMKSGDTNKMIYILQEKKKYTYDKNIA